MSDESTALFFDEVYRRWRTEPLDEALRGARLSLLTGAHGSQWQHPFYWAPFALTGAN